MKRLKKLFSVVLLVLLPTIQGTNAGFRDTETSINNTFLAGCWAPPSVPVLVSPTDAYLAHANSAWITNPLMDWNNSTAPCSMTSVLYQYESYYNPELTRLAYRSNWLSASQIAAPGTPDGIYFWRVRAKDSEGNISDFSDPWKLVVDRIGPTISDLHHLIATPLGSNEFAATITWDTDVLATGNLRFGTTTALENDLPLPADGTADATTHQIEIPGLMPETTYYYQASSKDEVGNETVSTIQTFETGNRRLGIGWADIVINEYLPNPLGADDAQMPDGEWVELYNKGSHTVDLSGWYLADTLPISHRLYLTLSNTSSSNPSTAGLRLSPGEFMVVYRNGNTQFDLSDNCSGDVVELFNRFGWLNDAHVYTCVLGDEVLINKTFARIPDGSNIWYDPIPTPNTPNQLEITPELSLAATYQADTHTVRFEVTGNTIAQYTQVLYTLKYLSDQSEKVLTGSLPITGSGVEKAGIYLGTCSEDSCTPDPLLGKIIIDVELQGVVNHTLSQEINHL